MSTLDIERNKFYVPDQLVDQLVKGYDALSVEIKVLDDQRRQLENRLSWAKQQYLDALKRFSSQTASQDFRTFLDELDEAGIVEAEKKSADWLATAQRSTTNPDRQSRAYNIQRATDARNKISFRRAASDAGLNSDSVRIWNGTSSTDVPGSPLEKDFTTYDGTPGRLKCPFVAPKQHTTNGTNGMNGHRTPRGSSISRGSLSGRRSKRSSFHDPIRAEICGFEAPNHSSTPSIEGSAPLCPIRFLDQHSPEEVAQYFEKHKHELPRSHEICVKRYQSNEKSIRELDAKYGTLVTMIQGLGQVHQPMLPENPEDEDGEQDAAEPGGSKDRVQKWATTVTHSLGDGGEKPGEENEDALELPEETIEERQPHFDRPLKDVRVGESPSRPWGITVPDEETNGIAARSDHTASPRNTPIPPHAHSLVPDSPVKGKCPFDHGKMKLPATGTQRNLVPPPANPNLTPNSDPILKPTPTVPNSMLPETGHTSAPEEGPGHVRQDAKTSAQPHQIVFNGPVFFGYNMDQALAMLQQSNLGSSTQPS